MTIRFKPLRPQSIKANRNGFTLIELSIVLMLTGVLLTGMLALEYTAIKMSRTAIGASDGASKADVQYALENVRSAIAQAYFSLLDRRLVFEGKGDAAGKYRKDQIQFAAVHANAEETGTPAVREVGFYLKKMPNTMEEYYDLIRREDQIVDKDSTHGGIEHKILSYVKSFKLLYSRTGSSWEDNWDSKEIRKLPRLIRIELVVHTNKGERRYESLAFPGLLFK